VSVTDQPFISILDITNKTKAEPFSYPLGDTKASLLLEDWQT
jgi:hypothetical protein